LLETIEGFARSHNDQWCMCLAVWPAFGEHHIDIVVIDIKVENSCDSVQVINGLSPSPDEGDEISKCS
jgi:hypothetical protein